MFYINVFKRPHYLFTVESFINSIALVTFIFCLSLVTILFLQKKKTITLRKKKLKLQSLHMHFRIVI